ncbi:MAG: transposase [Chloroflexi bacterium]|nr:transposase [Chloroflexota bacterium]
MSSAFSIHPPVGEAHHASPHSQCTEHEIRQARKYVIRKLRARENPDPKPGERRQAVYNGQVAAALAKIWEIFDYPCGQRLKPLVESQTDRLRQFGELPISDEVAAKLEKMSAATIDRKLKHQKEVLHLQRSKCGHKPSSALKHKIAIRLTNWDTAKAGYVEADLVFHCGASTLGQHICTVSATEISSGWWEGEPILGKSQDQCFWALRGIRDRCPFAWKGLDTDNGQEFISDILYKYCAREKLDFTRSRPSHKNDNAYIEEKNWTHVRKILGYLRYDTPAEAVIIRDLYRNELRLYKNFFQPVMKLISKERIGGRIKRKYGTPLTSYQRLMDSQQLSKQAEQRLAEGYLPLNPAALKRAIDAKINSLLQAHQTKNRTSGADPQRKLDPRMVTSFMIQQATVGLPS